MIGINGFTFSVSSRMAKIIGSSVTVSTVTMRIPGAPRGSMYYEFAPEGMYVGALVEPCNISSIELKSPNGRRYRVYRNEEEEGSLAVMMMSMDHERIMMWCIPTTFEELFKDIGD